MHRALSRSFVFSLAIGIAVLSGGARAEGVWALRDFTCRHKLVVDNLPGNPKVCYARFSTAGALRPDAYDIRVTDGVGNVVNYEILNLGPGDQCEILFDAPGCKLNSVYYVYFGWPKAPAPKSWKAEAGVVLQVKKKGEGDGNSWASFQKMMVASTTVIGRTLRGKIFDGYDPIGPTENIVTYYRAFFPVDKAGTYHFATNSKDASFLLINGKLIAEYPGVHNADAHRGQKSGTIDLPPGNHKLEYYHMNTGGDMMTCVAWQRPADKFCVLMEDNAFLPIARAKTLAMERNDGKPALDFIATGRDHLVVNGHYIVRTVFECSSPFTGDVKWDFGDGSFAEEKKDKPELVHAHGYLLPGTYTVTLSPAGNGPPPIKQTVVVGPVYWQREEWDDKRWGEYRTGIMKRLEEGSVKAAETTVLIAYAVALMDKRLLELGSGVAWKQVKEFTPADHTKVFYALGHRLQTELKDYAGADRAFQEVINSKDADPAIKDQSKLHRAGLLIHMLGKNQEGLAILKNLEDKLLVQPNEPILKRIYMADACAGMGMRDEAAKRYDELRPVVNLADRHYATGRMSRLLAITEYIKRGDCEAALRELQNIEWETPKERVSDETGMLRVEAYLTQKDYELAAILLRRLINYNPNSARMPEMLYGLVKAFQGLNRQDQVEEVYAKLKKEHPYAAETALAALMLKK
ncbi:MAG TPA: hypothetical protein VGP72_33650 [Planctomycetota bacterium]|jgi:hypothetical protein